MKNRIFKIVSENKEYEELEIYEKECLLDFNGTVDWIKYTIENSLKRGENEKNIINSILESLQDQLIELKME